MLHEASACSCIPLTEEGALEKSDVAFIGTAKSSVKTDKNGTTLFLVTKWLKPASENLAEVRVNHKLNPGLCGITFAAGAKYKVYTKKSGDKGELSTHFCSGTLQVSE